MTTEEQQAHLRSLADELSKRQFTARLERRGSDRYLLAENPDHRELNERIRCYAAADGTWCFWWPWRQPIGLFFNLGTTGGFGVLLLLAATAIAVIVFFAREPRGESTWSRLTAPALAAILLTGIAILAVLHYATLLGVPPGSPAVWMLPAGYSVVAVIGMGWALMLRACRPQVYAAIGLGAHAAGPFGPASYRTRS